jgi:hypothetical protein
MTIFEILQGTKPESQGLRERAPLPRPPDE